MDPEKYVEAAQLSGATGIACSHGPKRSRTACAYVPEAHWCLLRREGQARAASEGQPGVQKELRGWPAGSICSFSVMRGTCRRTVDQASQSLGVSMVALRLRPELSV